MMKPRTNLENAARVGRCIGMAFTPWLQPSLLIQETSGNRDWANRQEKLANAIVKTGDLHCPARAEKQFHINSFGDCLALH
jgi:hypothetical protein